MPPPQSPRLSVENLDKICIYPKLYVFTKWYSFKDPDETQYFLIKRWGNLLKQNFEVPNLDFSTGILTRQITWVNSNARFVSISTIRAKSVIQYCVSRIEHCGCTFNATQQPVYGFSQYYGIKLLRSLFIRRGIITFMGSLIDFIVICYIIYCLVGFYTLASDRGHEN